MPGIPVTSQQMDIWTQVTSRIEFQGYSLGELHFHCIFSNFLHFHLAILCKNLIVNWQEDVFYSWMWNRCLLIHNTHSSCFPLLSSRLCSLPPLTALPCSFFHHFLHHSPSPPSSINQPLHQSLPYFVISFFPSFTISSQALCYDFSLFLSSSQSCSTDVCMISPSILQTVNSPLLYL